MSSPSVGSAGPNFVEAYLQRIRYSGPMEPRIEMLRELHRAHMFSVPFENLDIGLHRTIRCEEPGFLRKIIEDKRGGFCYELNGAFAALLRSLGFQVTLLSARVPRQDGSDGPEFDHLTLRVDLDETWLADVGFGDCFLEPLRLHAGLEQHQDGRTYRIVQEGESLVLQRTEDDTWKVQYVFDLTARQLIEFSPMCHFHQTSPESPFTRKRICSRATSEGRITVADQKLIITRNGNREELPLGSEQEWRSALKQYFGVNLPEPVETTSFQLSRGLDG